MAACPRYFLSISFNFPPPAYHHLTFCVLHIFVCLFLVFPHLSTAPYGSRFRLFLFTAVFFMTRIVCLVHSSYSIHIFEWMNEWSFPYSGGNGGGGEVQEEGERRQTQEVCSPSPWKPDWYFWRERHFSRWKKGNKKKNENSEIRANGSFGVQAFGKCSSPPLTLLWTWRIIERWTKTTLIYSLVELQLGGEKPKTNTQICKGHRMSDGDKPVGKTQEKVDSKYLRQGGRPHEQAATENSAV